MSKHLQGIELAVIAGRRGYAPDIIVNTETDEQVAACANPDLTALFVAAPEMYELMCAAVRFLQTASQYHPLTVTEEKWEQKARSVVTKIEGGGDEKHQADR